MWQNVRTIRVLDETQSSHELGTCQTTTRKIREVKARGTFKEDLPAMGVNWGVAERVASDHSQWKEERVI